MRSAISPRPTARHPTHVDQYAKHFRQRNIDEQAGWEGNHGAEEVDERYPKEHATEHRQETAGSVAQPQTHMPPSVQDATYDRIT
ncbi:hypothetical protein Atai01_66300 [Amycolatopsis taiwanensis]|uniref:Uncharacterized protein n=1 Tax=Amycolatopsis taiwanensis TaxID=342230 RepID=A0A9W6VL01_9PSEU|nr:hypothetical protein Atai01_66300 [Amycolatopsis taiwanensis]